jgi:Mrp family chromosome partitioning ATPase
MSNYFQVLKQIEKSRSAGATPIPMVNAAAQERVRLEPPFDAPIPAAPVPPAPSATPASSALPVMPALATRPLRALPSVSVSAAAVSAAATPATVHQTALPAITSPRHHLAPALSDEGQRGIATLFDNIRALASGQATRTLVFAGATSTDSVHAVAEGLARHAQRRGITVFVAELIHTDSGPAMLVARMAAEPYETIPALAIDLNGSAVPSELNAWLDRTAASSDLVLLEAAPLADSIDAALLACACDGLVIVADAEVTPRSALQVAAERAQITGCRTLGVVLNGTKEHLPGWMRRLFGNADRGPSRGGA